MHRAILFKLIRAARVFYVPKSIPLKQFADRFKIRRGEKDMPGDLVGDKENACRGAMRRYVGSKP